MSIDSPDPSCDSWKCGSFYSQLPQPTYYIRGIRIPRWLFTLIFGDASIRPADPNAKRPAELSTSMRPRPPAQGLTRARDGRYVQELHGNKALHMGAYADPTLPAGARRPPRPPRARGPELYSLAPTHIPGSKPD